MARHRSIGDAPPRARPGPAIDWVDAVGVVQRIDDRNLTWQRLRSHRLALLGLAFIAILTAAALFAPLVAGQDPLAVDIYARAHPPSGHHLLGTDTAGRDVWARLVFAGRVSLSVGIVAVAVAGIIGLILGCVAGYYGGVIDWLVMRLTDIVMTLPPLVVILAVVSFVGPSIYNVMAVIGVVGWPGLARLLRAEFLSLRERDFVLAARSIGATDRRIIARHILPNAIGPIVVWASFGVAGAILTEAGLSFLGVGVQPPTPSWGNMLNAALELQVIEGMPWLWIPPGLAVALTVLAVNFIGDALRDLLDPGTPI